MAIKTLLAALATTVAATVGIPATAHADAPPPCADGQVQVGNGGEQAAAGHRRVLLLFSLTPGEPECSLTGYPGVDSGAGGPLIHAARTMFGYMGGPRDADVPPTVTVTATTPGHAVVEGTALDRVDPNRLCPTYTELKVTPPDAAAAITVPTRIDSCDLQVHPVETSAPSVAEEGCTSLGGTVSSDRNCHAHTQTAEYTVDISYPLDYPDPAAVSDFIAADRKNFTDWVAQFGRGGRGRPYLYHVEAETYRSTKPATTSLILSIDNDTGAAHEGHPATSFRAFNFDLVKGTPITFDTLFKPGARPLGLSPSDCRNFAITDDAVIFFFGEGQLMPADNSGPHEVSVPRSELAPLMA